MIIGEQKAKEEIISELSKEEANNDIQIMG